MTPPVGPDRERGSHRAMRWADTTEAFVPELPWAWLNHLPFLRTEILLLHVRLRSTLVKTGHAPAERSKNVSLMDQKPAQGGREK